MKHPEARYWALHIISEIGPDAADTIPAVVEALKDQRTEVRREAVLCLGHLSPAADATAAMVVPLMTDADAGTRAAAVWAAVRLHAQPDQAAAPMQALANDKDVMVRVTAAWGLAKLDPSNVELKNKAIQTAAAALGEERPPVRAAAARVLTDLRVGETDQTAALEALIQAVAKGDEPVAQVVAQALHEMGERAVPKMQKALERPEVRVFALSVLAGLGPKGKGAQAAVQGLTKDADPMTRAAAVACLAMIAADDKTVVESTGLALDDAHVEVRRAAADALSHLGPQAKPAEPQLRKHAEDADPIVKFAVNVALAGLGE
jgi:HEAT repeat protein